MQKEILKGLLAVNNMPKDLTGLIIVRQDGDNNLIYPNGEGTFGYVCLLPDGDWQLLGLVSEISEEVARELLVEYKHDTFEAWFNFFGKFINYNVVSTATESLHTCVRSNGFEPQETVLLKADVNNS